MDKLKAEEIVKYLPERVEAALRKADPDWNQMEEIRLRVRKPLLFYMNQEEYLLSERGQMIPALTEISDIPVIRTEDEDIKRILERASGYSLYAYEEEVKQGFLTLEGGHRIGLCGNAVVEEGEIKTLRHLTFLNIRLAHEKKGCASVVLPKLIRGKGLYHTLIISPPGCGKTTLLRDLIRQISNGFYYYDCYGKRRHFEGLTVGVVDERNEIGASVRGVPENDLGMRADVLDGCPKGTGIFLLLRSMAPKVIAVDEIGSMADFEAVREAAASGCFLLATAHGNSFDEFSRKKAGAAFLKERIFERYVLLSEKRGKGTVETILAAEEIE